MLGSLQDAIEFARRIDGESTAVFVVDWTGVIAWLDERGLADPDRLDEWLAATERPALELAPLARVRFASPAMLRERRVADLDALDSLHRRELLVLGYPDGEALRAWSRDASPTLAAPAVFASSGARTIALHRPRRAAAFAVTLVAAVEPGAVEQALRHSEARYRAIVEDQTDFIVRYRPDGVRTFVNEAYADFFGGKPEDFIGKSFLPLVAPEHMPEVISKLERLAAREAEVLEDEHLSIRHDGVACWTHWLDRAIFDERGNFIEFQAVGRDITERKNAEEQLARARKMEALATMAGGLAHDFNNTLSAILGLAELIVYRPEDRRAVLEHAEGILEATERASELTHNLLRLRRPQTAARLGRCDLREVIEAAARLLRVTLPSRITLNVELGVIPPLRGDGGQLTQAVLNLGLNARDAIAGDGTIRITAEPAGRGDAEVVVLRVTDDGAGIPEHVRARLFEPFFTTKPEGKGTGLGLAMVYTCVRAHRGSVEVESELGRGTTFEIRLPIDRAALQPEPEPERAPGRGELILLVDDEPMALMHARMILERGGYRVISAGSKDEALDCFAARTTEIAAVVTDLVMPNGGGRELEQALHALRPEVPVVLVTGGLAEHGRGEFAAIVEKPVASDELLRSLGNLLAR